MSQQQLYLGIDGGGTKCKARLENSSGEVIGEGLSGPANPAQSADTAFTSIVDAAKQALTAAGLPCADVSKINACLGLAGVNIPAYRAETEKWTLPFKRFMLTTDLHIACTGAHGGSDGAIVITGTGSSAFASVNGRQNAIGGHGFPLGDKASGAWLGWRALTYVLEVFDGLQPTSPLFEKVCALFNTTSKGEIVGKSLHYRPTDYAKLAPVVIELATDCDFVSQNIKKDGIIYLSSVIKRLKHLGAERISMIGGLASYWHDWLDDDLQRLIGPALFAPEHGAVTLAKHYFKEA